jgi:choice-of-anchor B domain-containing protein
MKKIYSLLFICSIFNFLAQDFQIDSMSRVNYNTLHNTQLNDIWGYTDELGNEYALVGARKGTSIVKITPPTNPIEVAWFPDSVSIWRDLSSWGNYAYVTTEAKAGLFIIDMNPLPQSTPTTTSFYKGPITNPWQSAHTLFIDNEGFAYIFGANRGNGGVIILDVHTDPMNPIEVGTFDNWYVHDGYVRNDTMYLAHIGEGFVSIVDITDKANPMLISTTVTPNNFTHNVWPNDATNVIFTTDETSNSFLTSYDISDPTNLVELDKIQDLPGSGTVIHNTHIRGNYAISSYYSSGIVVHDISRPTNLVEVGSYDTYPGISKQTRGCWGAFPFFSSGVVLATDMENGLFILKPNYLPARYIEGYISNANTAQALQGVSVKISGDEQTEKSKLSGQYATGIASGNSATLTYSKVGFYPQTHSVTIVAGQITIKNVALVPIPTFSVQISVKEFGSTTPVNDAFVRFKEIQTQFTDQSNGLGQVQFDMQYETVYEVQVEKWGKMAVCTTILVNQSNHSFDFELKPGYFDSFTFDQGWTSFGTSTTGKWERGEPATNHSYNVLPIYDYSGDCGNEVYITGNSSNPDPDFDDVDQGFVKLVSPTFDATIFPNAYLNYAISYFSGFSNNPSNDTLFIKLSNGIQEVEIQKAFGMSLSQIWLFNTEKIADLITPTSTMSLSLTTSDTDAVPTRNLVEAIFDNFWISDKDYTSLHEYNLTTSQLFPNPNNGSFDFQVQPELIGNNVAVFNQLGEKVFSTVIEKTNQNIEIINLASGMYTVVVGTDKIKMIVY